MTKSEALKMLLLELESAAASDSLPVRVRAAFEYYDNTPTDLCHITEAGEAKTLKYVGKVEHVAGTMRLVEWVSGACPEVGAEIWAK
jgi:hypothetical protein